MGDAKTNLFVAKRQHRGQQALREVMVRRWCSLPKSNDARAILLRSAIYKIGSNNYIRNFDDFIKVLSTFW